MEKERDEQAERLVDAEKVVRQSNALGRLDNKAASIMLSDMANLAETTMLDESGEGREPPKNMLRGFIDKIRLDPADMACHITYRIPVTTRNKLASPAGFEPAYSP